MNVWTAVGLAPASMRSDAKVWTTAVEEHLHGPAEVVALLAANPPRAPPAFHEVRDGLIVRWIDTPG